MTMALFGSNPEYRRRVAILSDEERRISGPLQKNRLGLTTVSGRASLEMQFASYYAVNEEPQPQLPVEFGFLNVNPEPITFVT